MDYINRRSAAAWIIGGTGWALTALIGLRAAKGSSGFYATESAWLVVHAVVLIGIVGLLRTAVKDGGRSEQRGFALAAVGRVLFFCFEVASMILANDELPVFPVAVISTGVGMLIGGTGLLRAHRWTGWTRFMPLAVGAYPFVFIVPVFAATGKRPPDGLIAGWGVVMALVGHAINVQRSRPRINVHHLRTQQPAA